MLIVDYENNFFKTLKAFNHYYTDKDFEIVSGIEMADDDAERLIANHILEKSNRYYLLIQSNEDVKNFLKIYPVLDGIILKKDKIDDSMIESLTNYCENNNIEVLC